MRSQDASLMGRTRPLCPRTAHAVWIWPVLLVLVGCAASLDEGRPHPQTLRVEAQGTAPRPKVQASQQRAKIGPIERQLIDVDYFQGLLVRAGVPAGRLPKEGRRLTPEDAFHLLSWVIQAEVPLRDFGPWRMASHLLWQVVVENQQVQRSELHARLRRFQGLLVLRPDGYLVLATTGEAIQHIGTVLLENGALRAEAFEVGPFYAVRQGMLYRLEQDLSVHPDTVLSGVYAPDTGTLGPAVEGAGMAVSDTVSGIVALVLHPGETLEGLAQVPSAVRTLFASAPAYWAHFQVLPHGEQVRAVSRVLTHVLLMCGTASAGAQGVASAAGRLGSLGLPVLSVSAEGALVLSRVAVPAGQLVTAVGTGAQAVYVLHMASVGAMAAAGSGAGGRGGSSWPPPPAGPGRWIPKNEGMSESALKYQCQVTGAPPGWVYRVERAGEACDFDGYRGGFLLDAKGPGYANKFFDNLKPKPWFEKTGALEMVEYAQRQLRVANGVPIRWYVAEEKAALAMRELLAAKGIEGIEVLHLPPVP